MANKPKVALEHKTTRLTDAVLPLFRKAFESHSQGEEILWDIAPQLMPNPQGEGSLMGALGVYAQMSGATLKTFVGFGTFLQPVVDEKVIDDAVRQIVEILRQSRSNQLAAMQAEGEQAARTGRPMPSSGLILP